MTLKYSMNATFMYYKLLRKKNMENFSNKFRRALCKRKSLGQDKTYAIH